MLDLWTEGPPVSPAALAEALGVTSRYVRKLIEAGVLVAVRLPNAGESGRPELGRLHDLRATCATGAGEAGAARYSLGYQRRDLLA